jgi:lipopolysaccharide transport system ATP-binding protein
MSDIVLQVENLGKCFKIYPNPWDRAREWGSLKQQTYHQPFWSLRNVSFEVRRGEFLGIIGENGAGKSTLLKMITGVLKPTEGHYQLHGKVLSLLELGTDFNFELSGRSNAIYSAELLGFPPGYVQSRLKEIEVFSELGEFFDRPMKLYSSGMKARLAFSLFAFLDCDVLILDEVLAVGDIFFQQKCYARLEELIQKQVTIILVTHTMEVVQQYCKQVILLHQGQIVFQGEPLQGTIQFYKLKMGYRSMPTAVLPAQDDRPSDRPDFFWATDDNFMTVAAADTNYADLVRYAICNSDGKATNLFRQGDRAYLCCEFLLKEDIDTPIVTVLITNKFNVMVHGKATCHHKAPVPAIAKKGSLIRFSRPIEFNIAPDEYVLGFALTTMQAITYAHLDELPQAELNDYLKICDVFEKVGVFYVTHHYSLMNDYSHWGICNLPGNCELQVLSDSEAESSKA